MTPQTMAASLRRFQGHFGLFQSGVLDRDTRCLMLAPRCAQPDTKDDGTATSNFVISKLKPIFHCNAKLLALGPMRTFALAIPTFLEH